MPTPTASLPLTPLGPIYIFGYGSLIEDESRQVTTPSARNAWPVRVRGIRRGWWARGSADGLTTTFLGALLDPQATCNGVLYEVTAGGLQDTDDRETAGYVRHEIPASDLTLLDGCSEVPAGVFYVYVNTFSASDLKKNLATPQFPIVQSYVDICVNGCLEVESRYRAAKGFTDEFFATTYEWNKYWVNDRQFPRRPFSALPTAGDIDTALKGHSATAKLFYEVELEPATWEDRKPVRPATKPKAVSKTAKRRS